jgi:hypothetical protein
VRIVAENAKGINALLELLKGSKVIGLNECVRDELENSINPILHDEFNMVDDVKLGQRVGYGEPDADGVRMSKYPISFIIEFDDVDKDGVPMLIESIKQEIGYMLNDVFSTVEYLEIKKI